MTETVSGAAKKGTTPAPSNGLRSIAGLQHRRRAPLRRDHLGAPRRRPDQLEDRRDRLRAARRRVPRLLVGQRLDHRHDEVLPRRPRHRRPRDGACSELVDRVVKTYRKGGEDHGYFATPADAELFEHELTWLLVHQYFSFNSPVWFNVGTNSPQQVSACFILSVDDSMDSILNWYKEEGFIFKGGSGAGLNLSRIRSSKELLSSGGTASGPVSFMRGADASAGTIKSGGATRRAAKMVVLDVNHPDIEEFVDDQGARGRQDPRAA